MLVLVAVLTACVHAPPADGPGSAAPAVAENAPATPPVPPPPPPPPPLPPLAVLPTAPVALPGAAVGTDARALTNGWRVEHNRGVGLLAQGDHAGALAAALSSLAAAPAEFRREPLMLVAAAGARARNFPVELAALVELRAAPDVPWELFYNGSLDAAEGRRPDLAGAFALEAFARSEDLVTVAPKAVRAALAAGDLDGALTVTRRLGSSAEPASVLALARALALAGRCEEARGLDPAVCS